jgi:hypothetical protein
LSEKKQLISKKDSTIKFHLISILSYPAMYHSQYLEMDNPLGNLKEIGAMVFLIIKNK